MTFAQRNYAPKNLAHSMSGERKCSHCIFKQLCLPTDRLPSGIHLLNEVVTERISLSKGEALYSKGESSSSLFIARISALKLESGRYDGRTQVMGFHFPGEWLG